MHRGQDFDESCDVYALAVVLWELATLAFPFHDKPPQAIPGDPRLFSLVTNRLGIGKFYPEVLWIGEVCRHPHPSILTQVFVPS